MPTKNPFFWLLPLLLSVCAHAAEVPPLTQQLIAVPGTPLAPALRLPDMDDAVRDLAELRGSLVVVNFWATWCPPCRREMPSLQRLYDKTRDQGVEVWAVNIGEDVDTVFPFLGQLEQSVDFPILLDLDGGSLKAWGVKGLPTTYVVDRQGRLVFKAVGGREFDNAQLLQQLLSLP